MRLIDLSREIHHKMPRLPNHPSIVVTSYGTHDEVREAEGVRFSSATMVLSLGDHAGTHVDAPKHFDSRPGALGIDEMPLETFFGDAVCVDVRQYPKGHEVTVAELEQAIAASGQEVREGDILLFCTDHWNRTQGTPAFLDGFSGVAAECVHWMADRGVKIFGVETISPDLVYQTDAYTTHRACAERGLTHYENLNNLKDVVNRRFQFYGFPLRLEPAAGSPIRAVGVVED